MTATLKDTPQPVFGPLDSQPKLEVKLLHPTAKAPLRFSIEAAGLDVAAFLMTPEGRPTKMMIPQRDSRLVPTGLALSPPPGHVALVCSRSGLVKSANVWVANQPGIIDPDYTGELFILLFNAGYQPYYVQHDQRIAQLVVLPLPSISVSLVDSFRSTPRGGSGFGSTGS